MIADTGTPPGLSWQEIRRPLHRRNYPNSQTQMAFFFTNSSSSDMYTPFEQCTLKLYHGQGPPTQLLRSMKGSRCWVDIWVAGSWLPLALAARGRRASLSRFKWLNGVLATHRCFDQPLSACVSSPEKTKCRTCPSTWQGKHHPPPNVIKWCWRLWSLM